MMVEDGFATTFVLEPEGEQDAIVGVTEPPERVIVGEPAVEVQPIVTNTVPAGADRPNRSLEPAFHIDSTLVE